ncbi:MAG: 30S ribosomal protein S3 [Candidatus Roizmanbacteria bacterium GW2011_GWA2_34_18]|uniref:Small ribosomal subunit protein uS3 n=1 Tax=Candidatus Roizmanbacteria bacterium GW2011_GWA2_34_18 TaxID=1618477 RepID=A0A0G0BAC2_9BACT|nr:MAG: 30S ribosomal protein S3 [Candidatus Roizmanbacteria bacterium GW2011_GWA2_34_18]
MGQKVHPRGLRLGIVYNWNSRWFFSNKRSFKDSLISDLKIRKALMNKLAFSVTQIDIERAINRITLIIYAVKVGMIIGRGGKGLEEIKQFVIDNLKKGEKIKELKIDIKIEPVKKPFLNAYYVSQLVAEKLVRNFPHRSTVHNAMNKVMEAGAKGVKIQLGGRVGGAEISRREKYFLGTIPTSTIREEVDFARYPALTRSGYVGVKVWICK